MEQRHLIENSNARPGDVFVPNWRGRPTAFDIVVTSPTCKSNLPLSSKKTGAVVFETFGGIDKDADFHLRQIALKTAAKSSKPSAVVVKQFYQRQSVLLQRSCASMIVSRAPPPPSPDIIGP